jgi:hypothetical protein
MITPARRTERLIALALLGALLFNYPLLALFARPMLVFGVPLLYLYLFAVWALLIVLVALAMRAPRAGVAEPPAAGAAEPRAPEGQ